MRKTIALAAALLLSPISAGAEDDGAHWMFVHYHDNEQVTVPCTIGLQCTVDFAPGEILGDTYNADPVHWKIGESYSADRLPKDATPELVVLSETPKKRMNLVVWARNTLRKYRLLFVPTSDDRPTYVVFKYDAPPVLRASASPVRPARKPAPPPTLSQIVDRVCRLQADGYTADSATDKRGRVDEVLASIRPARICHDSGHTFVQLPSRTTADVDVPVVYEDSASGVTQVDSHYFERDRIFVVNTVANVVLRVTVGKRLAEMHLRRTGRG